MGGFFNWTKLNYCYYICEVGINMRAEMPFERCTCILVLNLEDAIFPRSGHIDLQVL